MRDVWRIAWRRFNTILTAVGDLNARVIAVTFYFTVLVPFGIGSVLFSDPLRRKVRPGASGETRHPGMAWFDRDPVPTDVDAAKRQG